MVAATAKARWGWERKPEVLAGVKPALAGRPEQAQQLHRLIAPLTHFPAGRKKYPIAQQDLQSP